MNGRVYEGVLTVPAGTPVSAPATFVIPMPSGHIDDVNLVVPAGHNGLTGFQLVLAGTPIIPYGGATFLVANDYDKSWPIDQDFNEGQVVMTGFNTDIFAHTFYCRVLWAATPPPPVAVSIGSPGAATTAALTEVNQPPAETSAGGQLGQGAGLSSAGQCYDANFSPVDCTDPTAVYDSNGDPLSPAATAEPGSSQTAATAAGGCYDANGSPVDCTDPTAVYDSNGDLLPAAVPVPDTGPSSPPPGPSSPPLPTPPPISGPGISPPPAVPGGTTGGPAKRPKGKPGAPAPLPHGGPVGGHGEPAPRGQPRPVAPEPPHKPAPPAHKPPHLTAPAPRRPAPKRI